MAKKKTNQGSKPLSPKKFLEEKANKLPVYKCYITSNWETEGECHIIVARQRGNGNLCVGNFFVDTWCMGVKDSFGDVNMTIGNFEEMLQHTYEMVEIDYPTVHNLIYGAVEFAGEAGIEPYKDYWTWKGVLDEDTDDVPFIEHEYGKDGKYFLVARPGSREALMAFQLKTRLGDNFEFVIGMDEFGLEEFEEEEYNYDYPEYPDKLDCRYKFIADELLSKDNFDSLPDETINKILSLPADEVAEDIKSVILYEIGQTHKAITEEKISEPEESSIIHSLLLLAELKSGKALDAIIEILRQDEAFYDFQLGDVAYEFTIPALVESAKDNLPAIESFLLEPGRYYQFRSIAAETLSVIAVQYPEKRNEVVKIFRNVLKTMPQRLPSRTACDPLFAGFLICSLCDMKAAELLPEIEAVFETELVDDSICGDFEDVRTDILSPTPSDISRYCKSISDKYDFLNN